MTPRESSTGSSSSAVPPPDTPVLAVDHHAPHHMIDPLLILTVLARETERIGLVATALAPASSRPWT